MWPFTNKRVSKSVYKVSYIAGCFIDTDKVEFKLENMQAIFVEATDIMDAQAVFAKKVVLTPHVYVHRIEKVLTIEK